jgi:hypothetical protein
LNTILVKILGKIAKFGGKKQNFNDFSQNFELFKNFFENFRSNFEVDFGSPCDYHKSVEKNLKFL